MWTLVVMMMGGAEVRQAIPVNDYGSRHECVQVATDVGYSQFVFETPISVILDNGVIDGMAVMCIAKGQAI